MPVMGKYDHYLNEPINPGKSYRSSSKAAKKKAAAGRALRLVQLKREKAVRDSSGQRYIPWPEYLL